MASDLVVRCIVMAADQQRHPMSHVTFSEHNMRGATPSGPPEAGSFMQQMCSCAAHGPLACCGPHLCRQAQQLLWQG